MCGQSGDEDPFVVRASSALISGDICIDPEKQQVKVRGRVVAMTHKEYLALLLLVAHAGRVVSTEKFISHLYPYNYRPAEPERNLRIYIHKLRKKLRAEGNTRKYIEVVWGLGYRLSVEESKPSTS